MKTRARAVEVMAISLFCCSVAAGQHTITRRFDGSGVTQEDARRQWMEKVAYVSSGGSIGPDEMFAAGKLRCVGPWEAGLAQPIALSLISTQMRRVGRTVCHCHTVEVRFRTPTADGAGPPMKTATKLASVGPRILAARKMELHAVELTRRTMEHLVLQATTTQVQIRALTVTDAGAQFEVVVALGVDREKYAAGYNRLVAIHEFLAAPGRDAGDILVEQESLAPSKVALWNTGGLGPALEVGTAYELTARKIHNWGNETEKDQTDRALVVAMQPEDYRRNGTRYRWMRWPVPIPDVPVPSLQVNLTGIDGIDVKAARVALRNFVFGSDPRDGSSKGAVPMVVGPGLYSFAVDGQRGCPKDVLWAPETTARVRFELSLAELTNWASIDCRITLGAE